MHCLDREHYQLSTAKDEPADPLRKDDEYLKRKLEDEPHEIHVNPTSNAR